MKNNIPYIIAYLLAVIIVTVTLFAFRQVFFVMFLLILLMLPIGTYFCLFQAFRSMKVTCRCESETVEEGNSVIVRISVESKTFLPVLACFVTFHATNLFLPNKKEYQMSFALLPKKPANLFIPMETAFPGILEVTVDSVVMRDLLHLFSKESRLIQKIVVPVLPIPYEVSPVLPSFGDDGLEEYAENEAKGTISQDIKEIREYRPGDRLQRIHWKLSAKLQELFVKEMEQTSTLSLLVIPELTKGGLAETIRTFYSLCSYLIKKQERFQTGIFNALSGEIDFYVVTEEEGMYESYLRLCRMPVYEEKDYAYQCFTHSGERKGVVAHVYGKEVTIHEFE